MEKKEWKTPELTVLVRSKPEEAVLAACKGWMIGSGPSNFIAGCGLDAACVDPCSFPTLS